MKEEQMILRGGTDDSMACLLLQLEEQRGTDDSMACLLLQLFRYGV